MARDNYVLWGYRPDYVDTPIKLNGASSVRGLSSVQKARAQEGFLTAIYKAGAAPDGLKALVNDVRAIPASQRGRKLYEFGVGAPGRAWAEAWGLVP